MYRFLRAVAHPFLRIIYPTTVFGKENFISDSAVICCNHYASSDVLVVADHFCKKELNVLAKAELFKGKFSSWFLKKAGAIKVNRDAPELSMHKEIFRRLKAGKQIIIFPEGTRNRSGGHDMGELKAGAAFYALKAQVPIIPMIFHHKGEKFKRNYLIVGEAIYFTDLYGQNVREVKEQARAILQERMEALHLELDRLVEELAEKGKK